MNFIFNIGILILAFILMEAVAWFTHKYIMHGIFWSLHKDHHKRDNEGVLEKNDSFFLFFATPAIILFALYFGNGFKDPRLWIACGITLYGITYFMIHDIYIHQRFSIFRKTDNVYFKAIRRAHKVHHKTIGKEGGSCFGMLFVPLKFFKQAEDL